MNTQKAEVSLYPQPPEKLFKIAQQVPTPAILYDYDGIQKVVEGMQEDIQFVPDAKLNFALKACHNLHVLQYFSQLGLGCDVASVGELELALKVGFKEITTTGPAFKQKDFHQFLEHGVIPDLDSVSQLKTYGEAFPNTKVGLRLRIPIPDEFVSPSTFGKDSRFGMNVLDEEVHQLVDKYQLNVTRLHVHTGQMTPESMLYKAEYLLNVSEVFNKIDTIDMGGGLFYFYINRSKARKALKELAELIAKWKIKNRRPICFRFEPGAALLSLSGYLCTQVMAIQHHEYFSKRLITVDASAWNLTPWHKPEVKVLSTRKTTAPATETLIAGSTLHEGDFFGKDAKGKPKAFNLENIEVGDRILFSASGAYTMTNSRKFNRIPLPDEYALTDGELININKWKVN